MSVKKIALFIDADNISAKFGKQIIDTLGSRGEIFIRRIYGNWEKTILHGWNECILNFSLRAIQQPDFAAGKNATDMSLTIDAMDVLYGGKAEIFAIVSNDSDFTPLVIRLREAGMKIIGMGNANASNSFRVACHEFIDLDAPTKIEAPLEPKKKVSSSIQLNLFADDPKPSAQILSKTSTPLQIQPAEKISVPIAVNPKVISISDKKLQQIHDVLHESAKAHADKDGFSLLNNARADLRDKNFGFTVKDFGYAQLTDFMVAFPKLYKLRHDEEGKFISYHCLTDKPESSDNLQAIHDVLNEAANLHRDEEGFAGLTWAGSMLGQKNLSIKGSGHSTLSKFVAAFPNLYEVKGSGGTISYRCLTGKPVSSDKLQAIHNVLRETAKTYRDAKGFTNLGNAGTALASKNLSIKGFGHSTLSKFVAAFPNLYELRDNSYRCK